MMEFDRPTAGTLCEAYDRALNALAEAESVLWTLPDSPERADYIRAHSNVVIEILSTLKGPLVIQHPDLNPDRPDGPPDTDLDDEEERFAAQLSPTQVAAIDDVLLAGCGPHFRKVARIVGGALSQRTDDLGDVPLGFFATRVKALVEAGRLEAQGKLDYIRFSEVRLPLGRSRTP
ncbi:DUF3658 domain-containing protein [Roseateles depolymerans]|nr:DUF3658 domain-containing protein [Roseateles depolymerans]